MRRVGDEHKARIHAKALNDRLANAGKDKDSKEGSGKGEGEEGAAAASTVEAGGENEMNVRMCVCLYVCTRFPTKHQKCNNTTTQQHQK